MKQLVITLTTIDIQMGKLNEHGRIIGDNKQHTALASGSILSGADAFLIWKMDTKAPNTPLKIQPTTNLVCLLS